MSGLRHRICTLMFWQLFVTFMKIGFVSFGGGYAMIPVIQHEVEAHQWLSADEFIDVVAIAGMAPGPIATNTATLIGYKTAGFTGAVVSTAGISFPSLLLIVIIAAFFYKIRYKIHPLVAILLCMGIVFFS